MVTQTLQQALEHLYGLERRRDKLGLDGTRALLAALENPERRFRSVHVAGTNGKGSVCAIVERALRESGVRTGLFTSPHLVDFRERIRVDGGWADEAWLFETLRRIESLPEGKDRTFFEVATALGFLDFAERGVEWAVVEVGLGGRLDTTNVLAPDVCAITTISLDHTEILGDSIESIAREKAGIVKPGVPVVLGPGIDPVARGVIAGLAAERGAPVVDVAGDGAAAADAAKGAYAVLAPGLDHPSQRDNVATALAVLGVLSRRGVAVTPAATARGLALVRWPGRFEACPEEPRLWWDGAHNAEGMAALVRTWTERGFPAPARIVLALSRDKSVPAVLDAIAPLARNAPIVVTRSRNERALDPEALAEAARARGYEVEISPSVPEACRTALAATPAGSRTLLAGSLFAVGEAMAVFGGAPGETL